MKLYWVMFRNRKIGAFTTPQFIDQEPEVAAVQLSRALQMDEKGEHDKVYHDLVMFHLGEFDDSTGELITLEEPRALLDCAKVIDARKETVVNG